jgi:hypothetical protein
VGVSGHNGNQDLSEPLGLLKVPNVPKMQQIIASWCEDNPLAVPAMPVEEQAYVVLVQHLAT